MGVSSPPAEIVERQRRITVDEYHRMIDAGILHEDEHVELIDGFLVGMTPQKSPHAYALQELTHRLVRALGDAFAVRPQLPLTLGEKSEPEPDIAVVPTSREWARAHPTTALLVVEISRGSLRYDRLVKARLYARHGISEYWVVNLADRRIEVHRDPDSTAQSYRTTFSAGPGEPVTPSSIPGVTVDLADLLG
jgi:Uma2 family endonuclease